MEFHPHRDHIFIDAENAFSQESRWKALTRIKEHFPFTIPFLSIFWQGLNRLVLRAKSREGENYHLSVSYLIREKTRVALCEEEPPQC